MLALTGSLPHASVCSSSRGPLWELRAQTLLMGQAGRLRAALTMGTLSSNDQIKNVSNTQLCPLLRTHLVLHVKFRINSPYTN